MANLTVDFSSVVGKFKPMNAVNNGPVKPRSDQSRGNFYDYQALRIPLARIHDANLCYSYGGPHSVDVHAIFPDFNHAAQFNFVHLPPDTANAAMYSEAERL